MEDKATHKKPPDLLPRRLSGLLMESASKIFGEALNCAENYYDVVIHYPAQP
jgi:hypothetical protein